jgi:hypothetical protein
METSLQTDIPYYICYRFVRTVMERIASSSKSDNVKLKGLLEYDYSYFSSGGDETDDHNYSYNFANNFDKIIGWGRMALLLDYNSDTEMIRLRNDDVTDTEMYSNTLQNLLSTKTEMTRIALHPHDRHEALVRSNFISF